MGCWQGVNGVLYSVNGLCEGAGGVLDLRARDRRACVEGEDVFDARLGLALQDERSVV